MDKAAVLAEIKEMLKVEGKEELMEFAEDLAGLGYKAVKIVIEHSENKLDDVVLGTLDAMVLSFIDKIHEEK